MEYRSLRPADCRAVALSGEVTEWPKVYDWKSYVPQKGTAGSNPALSAKLRLLDLSAWYLVWNLQDD